MAWRFLRYTHRPTSPPAPVIPALTADQQDYARCVLRHWFRLGVAPEQYPDEMTTHGRFPCASRDERRVLAVVRAWPTLSVSRSGP